MEQANKGNSNILSKVNLALYAILVILVLFSTLTLIFAKSKNTPGGIRVFSVETGSMEPRLPQGSLVFTKPLNQYTEGDIITFASTNGKSTYTHRIVRAITTEQQNVRGYVTKGDANENSDPEVLPPERVLGKVMVQVPFIGHISTFAKTQLGFILLVIIPTTLLIYAEFNDLKNWLSKTYRKRKEKTKNDTENTNSSLGDNKKLKTNEKINKKNTKTTSSKPTKSVKKSTSTTTAKPTAKSAKNATKTSAKSKTAVKTATKKSTKAAKPTKKTTKKVIKKSKKTATKKSSSKKTKKDDK